MRCASVNSRLCDYLDGTISHEERQQFDEHISHCQGCAETLADAELALQWVHDSPRVEPPEELVSEILKTVGPAQAPGVLVAASAGSRGLGGFRLLIQPLFEPRFAMSMALALVSFSILTLSVHRTVERWRAEGTHPLSQVSQASREIDRLWSQSTAFVRENLPRMATPTQEENRPGQNEKAETPTGANPPAQE